MERREFTKKFYDHYNEGRGGFQFKWKQPDGTVQELDANAGMISVHLTDLLYEAGYREVES